jgi:hypothetical protein
LGVNLHERHIKSLVVRPGGGDARLGGGDVRLGGGDARLGGGDARLGGGDVRLVENEEFSPEMGDRG